MKEEISSPRQVTNPLAVVVHDWIMYDPVDAASKERRRRASGRRGSGQEQRNSNPRFGDALDVFVVYLSKQISNGERREEKRRASDLDRTIAVLKAEHEEKNQMLEDQVTLVFSYPLMLLHSFLFKFPPAISPSNKFCCSSPINLLRFFLVLRSLLPLPGSWAFQDQRRAIKASGRAGNVLVLIFLRCPDL
eukprot:765775-Hanusia_phi.AAC.2